MVDRLLGEQMADGGWNCEQEIGSTRGSFHSTINVLEGLLEHERANGTSDALATAQERGREYLLERRLLRRLSTGEIVYPEVTQLSFPTSFHYDVLRGSTTCVPPMSRQTRAWTRPSGSSPPSGTVTAAGRSRTHSDLLETTWESAKASRADGTRCAPCACCAGTRGADGAHHPGAVGAGHASVRPPQCTCAAVQHGFTSKP